MSAAAFARVLDPSKPSRYRIRADLLAQVLCDLGRVERLQKLGTNGPLLASAGSHSLFHCLFGRDAIRMAMDLLDDFPLVAQATLVELARLQGVRVNARAEEEPGRILHEFRHPDDPHARRLAGLGWDFPYFGAVDTTPQWIRLLGAYCARMGGEILDQTLTNREWRSVTIRDSLLSALGWIVGRLDDRAGGGYVWVRRASPHGIPNQVWEDSPDSYYYEDGSLFDHTRPYAPVHVQGYTYEALTIAADLLERSPGPLPFEPAWLRRRAYHLRQRILDEFWQPDLGTFALALGMDDAERLRPARVISSSAGHLLDGRLLRGRDAARQRKTLIARITEPDMVGGAGIRTRSTTAPRFRAGSYHNGSIWPMDTGVVIDGLRGWGQMRRARDLEHRVLAGCEQAGGFPEFFRGDPDARIAVNSEIVEAVVDGTPNRLEQPPQTNQGWTATRVWKILRTGNTARA